MFKRIQIFIYNKTIKRKFLMIYFIVFIAIMVLNHIGIYNYFSDTLIISKPKHHLINSSRSINDVQQSSLSLRGGNNYNNSIFKINDNENILNEKSKFFDFELKSMFGGGEHVKLIKFFHRRSCYLVVLAPLSCSKSEKVYLDLSKLYEQYTTGGLEIMTFLPAYGHFKEETRDAVTHWGARFPLYSLQHAHQFLKYLYSFTTTQPNFIDDCLFHKFLLDSNGDLLSFHGNSVMPSSLGSTIIDLIRGYHGKVGDF